MVDDLYQKFEAISKSMLIFDKQVIHSTLDLEETFLLYLFIVRYHGDSVPNNLMGANWPENDKLAILDLFEEQLHAPQINIKGKKYTITILAVFFSYHTSY